MSENKNTVWVLGLAPDVLNICKWKLNWELTFEKWNMDQSFLFKIQMASFIGNKVRQIS
jgi:hypothetical protein